MWFSGLALAWLQKAASTLKERVLPQSIIAIGIDKWVWSSCFYV